MAGEIRTGDAGPRCPYEVFQDAIDILGATTLQKIFSRGQTQLYRYGEKPEVSSNTEGNPITRLAAMLGRLVNFGGDQGLECALAALALLVQAVPGARVVLDDEDVPDDLDRVQAALDAHDALARLIGVARAGVHPHLVELETARGERALRRFDQAYARDFAAGHSRFGARQSHDNQSAAEFAARVSRPWWRRWLGL